VPRSRLEAGKRACRTLSDERPNRSGLSRRDRRDGCQQEAIRRPRAGQAVPQAEAIAAGGSPDLPVGRAGSRRRFAISDRDVSTDLTEGYRLRRGLPRSRKPSDCRGPSLRETTTCRELSKAEGSITLRKTPVKIRSSSPDAKFGAGSPDSLKRAVGGRPLRIATESSGATGLSMQLAPPRRRRSVEIRRNPVLPPPSGVRHGKVQK
jgi:hypothetical protein